MMEHIKENHALKKKIIFKAKVTNESPLLVDSGSGKALDFEVIRDRFKKPYIPGSGFAGMLRNSLKDLTLNDLQKKQLDYFIGSDEQKDKDSSQSHIIIDDLHLVPGSTATVTERDSVHINPITNLAIDKHKLDYEIIEPGAVFQFCSEITLRKDFDDELFKEFISFIADVGIKGRYQQGSFKSSGFGILSFSNIEVFEFDFPDKETKWFNFLDGTSPQPINVFDKYKLTLPKEQKKILRIEGEFRLKSSLIIRADCEDPINEEQSAPDKVHLSRGDKALLTGKSLKGVIRHRALKILKTKEISDADQFINNMFGFVVEKTEKQQPSHVKSFETEFENADLKQVQPRVKIDRFTGGTIEGALMQSKPAWHKEEKIKLVFEISEWSKSEAGLMMLVMKDLMTEDLPIGGEKSIGRGLLIGEKMTVKGFDGESNINISFDSKGITKKNDMEQIELVNKWVTSIN